MKILRRIKAATDYRNYDGYSRDEFEELLDTLYDNSNDDLPAWFDKLGADFSHVESVYISKDYKCPFIGMLYDDGTTWMFRSDSGWRINPQELNDYLE